MPYKTTLKVRFGDVDQAGIVYYPRIFHHFHLAFEDFFEEYVGIPYHIVVNEERFGLPTVNLSTNFHKPLRYGDLIDVIVFISHIGTSSVKMEFEAYKHGTDELCAQSSNTLVAVDLDSFKTIPIPEKYRTIFKKCTKGGST